MISEVGVEAHGDLLLVEETTMDLEEVQKHQTLTKLYKKFKTR
jgi:hypothetical protein